MTRVRQGGTEHGTHPACPDHAYDQGTSALSGARHSAHNKDPVLKVGAASVRSRAALGRLDGVPVDRKYAPM